MAWITNDNDAVGGVAPRGPDPHGQAALLLVESLLHGLIARSVLNVEDAVEVVTVAAEVKQAIAVDPGDTPADLCASLSLLDSIRQSLANDMP